MKTPDEYELIIAKLRHASLRQEAEIGHAMRRKNEAEKKIQNLRLANFYLTEQCDMWNREASRYMGLFEALLLKKEPGDKLSDYQTVMLK